MFFGEKNKNDLFISWNIKLDKLTWFVLWKQIPSFLPLGVSTTHVLCRAKILQGKEKGALLEIAAVALIVFGSLALLALQITQEATVLMPKEFCL